MNRFALICAAVGLIWSAPFCEAGLKVYYVRHGETGANVAVLWKHKPKEEWPDYVGDSNRFSTNGEAQVRALPNKLSAYQFDFIAVSPRTRALKTILPYLQANGRKAEIWPEMTEFDSEEGSLDQIGSASLPAPSAELFQGEPLTISVVDAPFFILRKGAISEVAPRSGGAQEAADIGAMLDRLVERIRTDFGNKDQSILLVGHGKSGRYLLRALTGDARMLEVGLRNTRVSMVEQQPDGSFKAMIINDKPVVESAVAEVASPK